MTTYTGWEVPPLTHDEIEQVRAGMGELRWVSWPRERTLVRVVRVNDRIHFYGWPEGQLAPNTHSIVADERITDDARFMAHLRGFLPSYVHPRH